MNNLNVIDLVKWLKGKTGAFVPTLIWLETPDHLKLLYLHLSKIVGLVVWGAVQTYDPGVIFFS